MIEIKKKVIICHYYECITMNYSIFFKLCTVRVSQSCTYVRSTKTKMYYITLPLHNSTLHYFDQILCE